MTEITDTVKYKISLLTNTSGITAKKIGLNPDKTLKKTAAAQIYSGTGQTLEIPFQELKGVIDNIQQNQCIGLGVNKFSDNYRLLSKKNLRTAKISDAYSRTKSNFDYPDNAIILFDYDYNQESGKEPLTPAQVIENISKICPGFNDCAKIVTSSSSANIYLKDELVSNSRGFHMYVPVQAARDITRFENELYHLAWEAGHGYIKISKDGSLLERIQLFDQYVFSPERLIFESTPVLSDGLTQCRPPAIYTPGTILDTSKTVINTESYRLAKEAIAEAKESKARESRRVRKLFIASTAAVTSEKTGITPTAAAAVITRACESNDLQADFLLKFDNEDELVSVQYVLDHAEDYDCQTLADPLDNTERCKAIFYANDEQNKPVIHSYKHGEKVYFLHKKTAKIAGSFWYEDFTTKGFKLYIDIDNLYKFLGKIGLSNVRCNDMWVTVVIQNHVCRQVENADILKIICNKIDSLPDMVTENCNRHQLKNCFLDKIDKYVSQSKIDFHAQRLKKEFVRDTKTESYSFWKNGFTETTANGTVLKPYSDLHGVIWESQIKEHEFKTVTVSHCDFTEFLQRTCTKPQNGILDTKRFFALKKTIGFLLHNYNSSYENRAVIFTESNMDFSSAMGGTGKSLIVRAISYLRNQAYIDGRNLKQDSPFAFQTVKKDDEIVFLDDVDKKFKITALYACITTGLQVEGKFRDRFSFSTATNPKIAITTNYAIAGNSDSDRRRRYDMELYQHFHADNRVEDNFPAFFDAGVWSETDWNEFYNEMLAFLSLWLSDRKFIDYNSSTVATRRIVVETSEEFIEYAESLPLNTFTGTAQAYSEYIREYNITNFLQKTFIAWLKRYAEYSKLQYSPGRYGNVRGFTLLDQQLANAKDISETNAKPHASIHLHAVHGTDTYPCVDCEHFGGGRRCERNGSNYMQAYNECKGEFFEMIVKKIG